MVSVELRGGWRAEVDKRNVWHEAITRIRGTIVNRSITVPIAKPVGESLEVTVISRRVVRHLAEIRGLWSETTGTGGTCVYGTERGDATFWHLTVTVEPSGNRVVISDGVVRSCQTVPTLSHDSICHKDSELATVVSRNGGMGRLTFNTVDG